MKKILTTPIRDEDLESLNIGDVVYLTGTLVTCRDVAHRRLIEQGRELPVQLKGGAIFHAGPIVRQKADGEYEMVSIGPTTSMRMEKFEKEFIRQTGVFALGDVKRTAQIARQMVEQGLGFVRLAGAQQGIEVGKRVKQKMRLNLGL